MTFRCHYLFYTILREINTWRPERNDLNLADDLFKYILFSWMKIFILWLKLHWILLFRVKRTIRHHWFGWWLGTEQAKSHYLNQSWLSLLTHVCTIRSQCVNTSRPRQNGRHFPDDIFKYIFLNENVWISLKVSLKFVPKIPINNISVLVQIMVWRRPGDKPLSESMMVSLLTHICVCRP